MSRARKKKRPEEETPEQKAARKRTLVIKGAVALMLMGTCVYVNRATLFPPPPPRSALDNPLFQAKRLLRNKKIDEALALAKQAHDQDPGNLHAILFRIDANLEGGRREPALALANRCAKDFPGNVYCLLRRGHILEQTGDVAAAAASYQEVLATDDQNFRAQTYLARCLLAQGLAPQAELHARAAVAANRMFSEGYFILGEALRAQEKFEDARGTYQQALRVAVHNHKAMAGLAAVFAKLGDDAEARRLAQRSLKLSPGYAPAKAVLASLP